MKRFFFSLLAALAFVSIAAAQSPRLRGGDDVGTAPRFSSSLRVPTDGSEQVESVPRTVRFNDRFAGSRVIVEGYYDLTYIGAHHVAEGVGVMRSTGAALAGKDTMSASWFWDFNGTCVKIEVSLERDPGQSAGDFAQEFGDLVEETMSTYPPSCSHKASSSSRVAGLGLMSNLLFGGDDAETTPQLRTQGAGSQSGVMSISWKHDPDGEGPMQPVDVTASVEKRDNESTRNAAKRLKAQADALMDLFPPNVPTTPSTGFLLPRSTPWRALPLARPMVV